jgi:Ankyrin repeats (3 copies)
MTKRKEMGAGSSSLAVTEPRKKTARQDKPEQKLLEKKSFIMPVAGQWDTLPVALWVMAIKFLTKKELIAVPLVSKMFINLFVEITIELYKNEFPEISDFDSDKYTDLSVKTQLSLFNNFKEKYDSFFTLIDRSYIPLFIFLNQYDEEKAIGFIHSKLQSTSDKGNKKNVTDMVFFQKNSQGRTAVILAQQLGLQDFLDYCFRELILNGAERNKDKYSLIKPGHYAEILRQLDTTGMSAEALWMYGCAYVCDQKKICREISEKKLWKKIWKNVDGISLVLVSALLSSINLAKHVLDDVGNKERDHLLYMEPPYERWKIYYTISAMNCSPIDAAAISKNKEIIDYFMSFSHQIRSSCILTIELVTFFVYSKDISGIRRIHNMLMIDEGYAEEFLNMRISINPKYLGIDYELERLLSPLGVAIAKNWLPGVMEFIDYGIPFDGNIDANGDFIGNSLSLAMYFGHIEIAEYLLHQGADANGSNVPDHPEPSPIYNAIKKGRLDCVQLLVKHTASLTTKVRAYEIDEYPLISAIMWDNKEIIQYIIGVLGMTQALHQLGEELSLRSPNLTKERPMISYVYKKERSMISIVYNDLLKQARPAQGITLFGSGTDDSLQSTSSQDNDLTINLTP